MAISSKLIRRDIAIMAVFLAATSARAHTPTEPKKANFCDVVASPPQYFGQTLSVEVILWPGEHLLSLFGAPCVPREGYNVTTEAVLPVTWESLPNGKKLRGILKRHRPAKVTIVGVFERNGQWDGTRFRFIISQIKSVSKYSGGWPTLKYGFDIEGAPCSVCERGVSARMVEQSKSGTNAEIVYDCLGNKLALMKGLTTIDHAFAALPGGGTAVYTGGAGPFYYRHAEWLGSSARERRGRRVPQAAVRAFFVVLLPPRGDLPPRLEQVLKPTRVQTLVARAARFR